MFLDTNILCKTLMAGFFNGLQIGRKLRYDRKKHFYRFQHSSKKQRVEINSRIRSTNCLEEQHIPME